MTETTRVWLVKRSYGSDEDLVTLVYATPDGTRQLQKQLSHQMLRRTEITAARDVETERLETVGDEQTQKRYANEATRLAETHDPDEVV